MYTEVLVQGTGKLVQRRRHLEALLEDTALALDAHDLGPLDEPVQVLLGRKRTADTELLRPLLEERVGNLLLHGPNVTKSVSQSNHGTLHIEEERGGAQHILFSSWPAPAPCHLASGPADLWFKVLAHCINHTQISARNQPKITTTSCAPPRSTKPD